MNGFTFFEPVSNYIKADLEIPTRATTNSAGYDLTAAKDYIIQPYEDVIQNLAFAEEWGKRNEPHSLEEIATLTKKTKDKPTLVSTGMKCKIPEGCFLSIVARSSLPLKHWLIVANAPGIVDADYYNNPDNEGEIFVQLINLSPFPIVIHKGDKIAQGIIIEYNKTTNDTATGMRTGGHGSTSK